MVTSTTSKTKAKQQPKAAGQGTEQPTWAGVRGIAQGGRGTTPPAATAAAAPAAARQNRAPEPVTPATATARNRTPGTQERTPEESALQAHPGKRDKVRQKVETEDRGSNPSEGPLGWLQAFIGRS